MDFDLRRELGLVHDMRFDHKQGQNYINEHLRHQYIHIPKCASCWGKNKLTGHGFRPDPESIIKPDHRSVVILRDPIERYASALAEWLPNKPHYLELFHNHPDMLDLLLTDIVITDEHTLPQIWFLQDMPQDTVFFWHDSDLQTHWDLYWQDQGLILEPMDPVHVSTLDNARLRPKNFFLQAIMSNFRTYKRIKNFFAGDYRLIKSVTFFNRESPQCLAYDYQDCFDPDMIAA